MDAKEDEDVTEIAGSFKGMSFIQRDPNQPERDQIN